MFEGIDRREAERHTHGMDLINSRFIQLIPALFSDRYFSEEHHRLLNCQNSTKFLIKFAVS